MNVWSGSLSVSPRLSIVTTGLDPVVSRRFDPGMGGWVYFMTNRPFGVIYVGVTSDLLRRVQQHREAVHAGFTARYNAKRLVYFEQLGTIGLAIQREKNIKALVARVEGRPYRGDEPDMARSVVGHLALTLP